jgi:23S rRNA (guanosine2251-2'-O)-methyltransferase
MSTEFLYGRRPVVEALRAGRRSIKRLIVDDKLTEKADIVTIIEAAQRAGIPVDAGKRGFLEARAQGGNHQGVVLETSGYPYVDFDTPLELAQQREQAPFILMLDLLQDVQNVGTLLRTAEAVGVHGIYLQDRRSAKVTPAVVSASSGGVEHLNVVIVTNLVNTMKQLKEHDLWFAGLAQGEGAQRYDKANLKGAMGIVVGSEGAGLRRLVHETCDFIVNLPMQGRVESLNASIAGSVILYETWRARGFG